MQGQRVERIPGTNGLYASLSAGQYAKFPDGTWYGCTPNGHGCNLSSHEVIEHDDGTITVSPSIKVSNETGEVWHGYLERGVWRSC